jgi:hypothetical protein
MQSKFWLVLCLAIVGLIPLGAMAQTPEDDRRIAEELSINNSRPVLLRELAPKIMPDCQIAASEQDVSEFFAYWRNTAKAMQIYRKANGIPDRDAQPPPPIAGYTFLPQMPLAEVENINPDVPGMPDAARDEIEIWHILSCVVHKFGASQFNAHYGFFGAPWPEPFPATFVHMSDGKRGVMIPDMTSLEPLDALGRFFRKAQTQGLWALTDPTHERYFFYRYESSYFANTKRSDTTDRWFDVPPWQPSPSP